MKCKTSNDSEHKDNNLPYALNMRKTNQAYDTVEQNLNCELAESERDNINSVGIDECHESTSRDFDPLLNSNSEGKLSAVGQSGTKRQDNQKVKENEINSKDYDQGKRHVQVPLLCAVDGVTPRLFPETAWNQKEDTVYITIHLIGVEQYQCRISSSHLLFM